MAENTARLRIEAKADVKELSYAEKALRGLKAAIGPVDAEIARLKNRVADFGLENKKSEATIAAQINAFKKLRQQATIGSQLYDALTKDINGLSRELAASRAGLTDFGNTLEKVNQKASGKTAWKQFTQDLANFNRQAAATGKAVVDLARGIDTSFDKAGRSVDDLGRRLANVKQQAAGSGGLFSLPDKAGPVAVGTKGLRDIQAFTQLVKRLQEQAQTTTGKVARLSEGMFALAATGAGVSGITSSLGGVAGAADKVAGAAAQLSGRFAEMGSGVPQYMAAVKRALNGLSLDISGGANGIANWAQSIQGLQGKLSLLNAPLEALGNAFASIGPEWGAAFGTLAIAAAAFQDEASKRFKEVEVDASKALQGISDETQKLLRQLAELGDALKGTTSMNQLQALRSGGAARFNDVAAGTDASRRAANTIANAEYRIKAEQQAQAQVLEAARQRYRGTTESVDALSERLSYLQQAMKLVDQSTAEGNAEFASFASEADRVKRRIDSLSNSYRTVADAIRDAAQAQGQYANQSTVSNYLNRREARRQEEALAAAREQLARPQTPLLPAAGQTSFTGTVNASGLGGGARRLSNYETAGTRDVVGPAMGSISAGADEARQAARRLKEELDELTRAGRQSFEAVNNVFNDMGVAARGSINGLQAQRKYWEDLRNSVDTTSREFRQASRELDQLDRKLERYNRVGGGLNRVGQTIGAISASSVFGGPEGLVGAGIGAFFGPGGALAGGAAGAQIGQFRQQLGQFSTYSADIEKQRIALKGVTGSLEEYQRALKATAGVSAAFNIPQLEATQQMTRLSAAVIGAGGKVADAEVVFRNISAAIKASGGSADDVQGALTALSQVFSKGKVSAEELSGQLGERLPGAVTMFAKATGRTLPQLQKDLEQGTVGLNDLMKFIVSPEGLGKFEATAKKISDSSADAGARLTKTFADTKEAVGKALAPIGAQIQDSLAKALKEATPSLTAFAKSVAELIKLLVDNAGLIGTLAKLALTFGGVTMAMKALSAVQGPLLRGLGLIAQSASLMGASLGRSSQQAVIAQQRLSTFGTTVGTLARSLAAPIVVTVAIVGAQLVIDWFNKIKQARDRLKEVRSQATGEQWLGEIGGKSLDKGRLTKAVDEVGRQYERVSEKITKLNQAIARAKKQAKEAGRDTTSLLGPAILRTGAEVQLRPLEEQLKAAIAERNLLESRYQAGIRQLPSARTADPLAGLTSFVDPTGKDEGTGKKKKDEAKQRLIEELNLRLQNLNTQEESAKLGKSELDQLDVAAKFQADRLKIQMRLIQLQQEDKKLRDQAVKNLEDENKLLGKQANEKRKDLLAQISNIGDGIDDVINKFNQKIDKTENPIELELQNINNRISEARQNLEQFKEELVKRGSGKDIKPELDKYTSGISLLDSFTEDKKLSSATDNAINKDRLGLEAQIKQLSSMKLELSTLDNLVIKYGDSWKMLSESQRKSLEQLAAQRDKVAQLREFASNASASIGSAFSNMVTGIASGLASGTANVRESLATMFKDIGKAFLDMANQMIAKMVTMFIFKTILGLFGGGSSSSGGLNFGDMAKYSTEGPISAGMFPGAAKGAYFTKGTAAFAKGGMFSNNIVRRPTLFKYANGGTVGTGLMGEAGPEAVMPLSRGRDGKLGVTARMDDAMRRYTPNGGGTTGFASQSRDSASAPSGPMVVDVRYSVERINSVDYVTADQFQAGMKQAAAQGAAQGEQRTLRKLQMSPSVRRRVGV